MFRIKTDIRQYKCETKDKVEKLIRNWVIRPSDLIYDADGKDWAPIGEHPAFVRIFGVLDEQEKNTPDTVVTRRSPYVGTDSEAEEDVGPNGVDAEADAVDAAPEVEDVDTADKAQEVEEVTQLVDREEVTREEVTRDEPAPERDEVTQLVGRPTVADSEADEDVRSTDVFEHEEIAESIAEASKPKPPEAPDGVEVPRNDGEVTMMTERTLEMLKITDEDDAADALDAADLADAADAADVSGDDEPEGEESEEITGVRERQPAGDDAEAEADEAADPDHDEDAATAESERENARKRREKVLESGPKLGRHDLPEELFATNEISSPEVQEQIKRLDELRELDPSDPTLLEDEERADASESGDWPTRLDEDSGIAEAWDVIAEELPAASDLDDDDLPDALAPTDEGDRPEIEDDEADDEWSDDTSEPAIRAPHEFVSEGYQVPLPFPIRPTAEDIRAGVAQGRVSRSVKDRVFPLPEPKALREVHMRYFDLSPKPPRDRTVFVFAGVALIILVIAFGVATC